MAKQVGAKETKSQSLFLKDDLLFHPAHGLCRIDAVTPASRQQEISYALLPVSSDKGKVRFIIPQSAMNGSGFRKLLSRKEAQSILDYFKSGKKKPSAAGPSWELASTILTESSNREFVRDPRKRQLIEKSVQGLASELAFVLEVTSRDVAERIRKNLGPSAALHPMVSAALANVGKD